MSIQRIFFCISIIILVIQRQRSCTRFALLKPSGIFLQMRSHSSTYKCHCFKCLACPMLMTVLISRGHLKLLSIVTSSNYLSIRNQYIYDSLEKKAMEVVEHILYNSVNLPQIFIKLESVENYIIGHYNMVLRKTV